MTYYTTKQSIAKKYPSDIDGFITTKDLSKIKGAVGANSAQAILTECQVREIRRRYIPYKVSHAMLAKEFQCSKDAIAYIVNGITWRHIL